MINNFYFTSLIFMAGFCLFSAIYHFTAEQSRQQRIVHQLFAGITLSLIGTILTSFISSNTSILANHIIWVRVNIAFNVVMYAMLPWFFAIYSEVRAKRLLVGSTALCILLFFINLTQPNTLLYSEIHGIDRLLLPWGEEVFLTKATPGIWGNISFAYLLFVCVFAFYAVVRHFRLNRKRSSLFMMFAVAFLIAAITQNALVKIMGVHNLPPLGAFGFLGMVIIMGMVLTHELREDRKLAEVALQLSERKARSILDQSIQFIGLVSPDGTLLDANHAALELAGVTLQDVYNKPFWESPWWSHSTELQNKLRESIKSAANGEEVRFEASHPATDGSLRYIDFSLRPVKNEQGDILYLIPEGHDITERKLAEEKLNESQRKLAVLMGNLPGLAFRCMNDQDWTMIFMSEGGFELTGYYPHELEGNLLNSYGKLIHQDDAKLVWQKVQDAISNNTFWQIEYRIHTKDGIEKWVWERGCGVYSNTGELEVLEGFISDITERKKAEEALTKSEEKYRYIVDNAPIGIFQRSIQGSFNFCNLTLAKQFECNSIDEFFLNYNDITKRWADPEKFIEFNELILKHGEVLGFENKLKLKSGKTKWFSLYYKLDSTKSILDGFSLDITERKFAERALNSLATNFAGLSGKAFFEAVSKHIAIEMGIDYVYVGELSDTKDSVRVLGGFALGENMGEMLYNLTDTPCSDVIKNDTCLYPTGIQLQYPKDILLQQMGIDSYLGSRIYNKEQEPIGLLVALHSKPINRPDILSNLFSIFLDRITAELHRMNAEKKLSESQALYHDLVEASQDLIWQCDAQGRYIYLNLAFERLFGYHIDEMLGRPFTDFQSPQQALRDMELFGRLLQADNIVNGYESVHLKKDGTELHLVFNAKVVFDAEGHMSGTRGTAYDITQRKRAADELQQSEARLSALLSSMKDIIFEIDLNGCFEGYFAQENKSLYAQPDFFIGKKFEEVLPEDVSVLLRQAIVSINSGNIYEQFEYHITVDNKIQWEHAVITPRYNKLNEFIGVTVVCRNITEHKTNEAILTKLFTAINYSKASIVITDIEGNIEFANPYFTELTGFSKDEYLGKNPKVLKSGIHTDEYYKLIWETIKSGNTWEGEFCNRKKNGELYWEKSIITPIKNEKEEILNFVAVKSDITNEKKHEYLIDITLELYEKSEHLTIEEILKYSLELGIQLTNSEIGFFHFVNVDQETISLQAWSAKTMDICNVPVLDKHYSISKAGVWVDCFYQKEPVFHNDYSSLSHKKGLPEGHSTLIRDLSVPVVIENQVVAIFGVGNKKLNYNEIDSEFLSVFAENVWNIIRRKNAEIDTIKAKEHAEKCDRLKSAFLCNMSHEIRTPMNGILGFSTLLSKPGIESEKQQKYIKMIQKSGSRMLNIISEIMDISKIESGLTEIRIKAVDLNKQLEFVYDLLNPDAQVKAIDLFVKNSLPKNEAVFMTDEEKLYGILINLVKNAIKYTDKGSIEFGYYLTSSPTKLKELQFYVKDTGIGIPKDRQQAIFERFVQADVADVQARQGAGLGLSIAKAYVEMLGGKIWVESVEGKGSSFYFTLPENTEPEEKKFTAKVVPVESADNHINLDDSKLKILIVEDDEVSELLISQDIKPFSNQILKTTTGVEAIKVCRNNPDIDLILMDIRMPDMNGYEATRQIRQFDKDVIIIAQTAFGLSGDREKAIEAGCNDHIAKPINKDELLTLIQKYFKK